MKNAAEDMDFSVTKEKGKEENVRREIENKRRHSARVGYNTCYLFAIAYLKETDMSLLNVPAGKDLPEIIPRCYRDPWQRRSDQIDEVDKESGALFVDRFMSTAMFYPCNYGYINHTLSLDGDPDVLVPTPVSAGARSSDPLPSGWRTENDRRIRRDAKLVAVPHTKLSKNMITAKM